MISLQSESVRYFSRNLEPKSDDVRPDACTDSKHNEETGNTRPWRDNTKLALVYKRMAETP